MTDTTLSQNQEGNNATSGQLPSVSGQVASAAGGNGENAPSFATFMETLSRTPAEPAPPPPPPATTPAPLEIALMARAQKRVTTMKNEDGSGLGDSAIPMAPPAHGSLEGETETAVEESVAAGAEEERELVATPSTVPPAAIFALPDRTLPGRDMLPRTSPPLGPVGKRRSGFAVVALTIVTLGIYGLVWYSRVNREMGDFDHHMRVKPGRSTWAVALPWLVAVLVTAGGATRIILDQLGVLLPFDPLFTTTDALFAPLAFLFIPYLMALFPFSLVAVVMTNERIRTVEDRVGIGADVQMKPVSAASSLLIPLVGLPKLMAEQQRRLNAIWNHVAPEDD